VVRPYHRLNATLLSALFVAAGASLQRPALAAPTDSALAETLYQEARALVDQGNYAEACPKFAESYRVAPATGTLLNLAQCHEAQGKFASAWAEFQAASVASRRDNRPDRVQYADEHAKDLFPKLSRLTITLAPGVDTSTLEITLDGTVVGAATLGVAVPLDPGEHVVDARSPGKQPFSATVTLGAVADQKALVIPELTPAESAVTPTPAPPPPNAAQPAEARTQPSQPADRSAPIPTSVYVAGGATLALGAASIVTGLIYLDRRASYQDYRSAATDESDQGPDYDSAKALGVTNVVLWSATAVGAGVTAYLYFTRPKTQARAVNLSATVSPGFSGISARGEF
jgi:tetratricopeptide (TPR) repeat protein